MEKLMRQGGFELMVDCGICDRSARRSSARLSLNSRKSSPRIACDSRYKRAFCVVGRRCGPAGGGSRITRACSARNCAWRISFWIGVSRRRDQDEAWLKRDLSLFRVLPVVEETSVYYAAIRSELKASASPIPSNEAWIAALAREHRMPIVSRDAHFDRVRNVERLGWS